MGIIKISEELSRVVSTKSKKISGFTQESIDCFIKGDSSFQTIVSNIKKILNKNQYVVVKNIGFAKEKEIFESFVKQFGEFYGAVEYTDIKIECPYIGCQYIPIELHNDDAIDMYTQPTYGFIQIVSEDRMLQVKNGVVIIDEVVEYLSLYDEDFLESLYDTKIPMLSYGVNYDGQNTSKVEIAEPILYKQNDETMVRFDLSRVMYFYWKNKIVQPSEIKRLLNNFLSYCKKFKREYILETGDILIHNNKKCLHDRSECSLELNIDGSTVSREIFVSFTRGDI